MLNDLLKQYNLQKYTSQINTIAKDCLEGKSCQNTPETGDSKVGGIPDVAPGFNWPFFNDYPLEFIAQINCNGLKSTILPETGILQFFYDNRHWGSSIKEQGFIHVNYIENIDNILPAKVPKIEKKKLWGLLGVHTLPTIYKESKLEFEKAISLPDIEELPDILRKKIDHVDELSEAYSELKAQLSESRFIQIGGYPNPVQYDGIADRISKLMQKGTKEQWKMIFEISDNVCTDMMWGDAGRLHFFVYNEELEKRLFDNVWMEFQCG